MWLTSSLAHLAPGWREHAEVSECVGGFESSVFWANAGLFTSSHHYNTCTCTSICWVGVLIRAFPWFSWCIFIERWDRWWRSAVHLLHRHVPDLRDWTLYGATEPVNGCESGADGFLDILHPQPVRICIRQTQIKGEFWYFSTSAPFPTLWGSKIEQNTSFLEITPIWSWVTRTISSTRLCTATVKDMTHHRPRHWLCYLRQTNK